MAIMDQLQTALRGADDQKLRMMAQKMSQFGPPDQVLGGQPPMQSPVPPPGTGAMMNPMLTDPSVQVMPAQGGGLAQSIDPALAMQAFQLMQGMNANQAQRAPMPQVSIPNGMGQRPMMPTDTRFQNQAQNPAQQFALARYIQGLG